MQRPVLVHRRVAGETEADHDRLLEWLDEARLDWVGFFPFSNEHGAYAADLDGHVPAELVAERLPRVFRAPDAVTAGRRTSSSGRRWRCWWMSPGEGRTYREAPEIDEMVSLPADVPVGSFVQAVVRGADGPDLIAAPIEAAGPAALRRAPVPAGVE